MRFAGFYADVRYTGEADLANDPKLESLVEVYLKNKENKLRNIAFDANATNGGIDQTLLKPSTEALDEMMLYYISSSSSDSHFLRF